MLRVMPAKAGIHGKMDPDLRRDDDAGMTRPSRSGPGAMPRARPLAVSLPLCSTRLTPLRWVPKMTVACEDRTPPLPWAIAVSQSATWRAPHSPRNWRVASISRNRPYMPGWQIREPAAIGVDRQCPARGDTAAFDKRAALALFAKAEVLEEQDRVDRKRIVEFEYVDVRRREPCHVIGGAARSQRAGHGQVGHARNIGVGDRLAGPQHIGRRLFERAGALGRWS